MRFPPDFLDEIRTRLPVSELVGRRVKLNKAGREWKGLSPFNQEKTPSFFVNDQKAMWFDFSSGRNGDIFDFVMATEGVSFPEAVERLAALAGLPVPKLSPAAEAQAERRRSLYEVVELAAKFFESALATRAGARARGYLADRGIDPATQLEFRIGYAPAERFALKEHLGAQGVPVADMVEAGLLVAGEDIPVPFDRFRERVMFPITDLRDRVIAFGGRAIDKDVPAKYLNSPETPLFHKGATLYHAAAARVAAHKGAPLIVVEGYVDVIAMATAGFPATVAPLGTALTAEQLSLLWKIADEPVLLFDGDDAGRRAAYRAVDLALPLLQPGKSLGFATLPQGHDPDDLIRTSGPAAMADVLAAVQPLAEVLWLREIEPGRFDTPERRARLEARFSELTGAIGDKAVRWHYTRDMRNRCWELFAPLVGERSPSKLSGARTPRAAVQVKAIVLPPINSEALVILAALRWPHLRDDVERLAAVTFSDLRLRTMRDAMLSGDGEVVEPAELARYDALLPRSDVDAWWDATIEAMLARDELAAAKAAVIGAIDDASTSIALEQLLQAQECAAAAGSAGAVSHGRGACR